MTDTPTLYVCKAPIARIRRDKVPGWSGTSARTRHGLPASYDGMRVKSWGSMAAPMRAIVAFHCFSDGLSSTTGSSIDSPNPIAITKCARAESDTSTSMPPSARMCATSAIAFLRRCCTRSISMVRTCSSTWARVSASSSKMSQLAAGCSYTSCETASMTASGGIISGRSTASRTRSAAEDRVRVVMTSSNNSVRPPVKRRTV